ncbi:hypothetical protein J9303_01760 [Bacillaceae bacterium Marseille-Q3522]|nr:hypothetical protein [Bacillaceae bacterium Marseille-Q3522]
MKEIGFENVSGDVITVILTILAIWMNEKDTAKKFENSTKAHGVSQVASVLGKESGKRYKGNDLIRFKKTGNGKKIEVNLSSAVRVYQIGMSKYQEKEEQLNKLRAMYDQEYVEDFNNYKRKLFQAISDMETNPNQYRFLLQYNNAEIRRISVHEDILPLDPVLVDHFESLFYYFQEEQRKGIELLEKIRSSIENLFQEDKTISVIFDLR